MSILIEELFLWVIYAMSLSTATKWQILFGVHKLCKANFEES